MNNYLRVLFLLLLALVFLTVYFSLKDTMWLKEKYRLTVSSPLENAPPELVLATTALGGFRGIIVDYLWIRAMRLQESGKYFELVQLYDWIGKMEPRIEAVWSYNAWNMAYNISVELETPEERWMWIKQGIKLLRDSGLRYNPRSSILHRELAWIYQHKIGGFSDVFHWQFKKYLSDEMEKILGERCLLLPQVAASEREREKLLGDKGVLALINGLRERGFNPFSDTHVRVALWGDEIPVSVKQLIEAPEKRTAWGKVENHLRHRALVNEFGFEPERMVKLAEEYGPLDWRLAQSHSVYWLAKGLESAEGEIATNYERMLLHAIISLCEEGRIVKTDEGFILAEPDFRFVDAADRMFVKLSEKYQNDSGLSSSHRNFLESIVVLSYTYGRGNLSLRTYGKLRDFDPSVYQMGLEVFIFEKVRKAVSEGSLLEMSALVRGFLRQSLLSLAIGEDEKSAGLERLARLLWNGFSKSYVRKEGEKVPAFEDIRSSVLSRVLRGEFPEHLIEPLKKRLGLNE